MVVKCKIAIFYHFLAVLCTVDTQTTRAFRYGEQRASELDSKLSEHSLIPDCYFTGLLVRSVFFSAAIVLCVCLVQAWVLELNDVTSIGCQVHTCGT